jgi:serine protease AprX
MPNTSERSWGWWSAAFALASMACSSESIGKRTDGGDAVDGAPAPDLQSASSPSGAEVVFDADGKVAMRRELAARVSVGDLEIQKPAALREPLQVPIDKLNGALRAVLSRRKSSDAVEAIVTVASDAHFQPLPTLDESQPRDSEENLARLEARRAAFERMAAPVRQELDKASSLIRARGGEVLEQHVVSSSLHVRLPAAKLKELQAEPTLLNFAGNEVADAVRPPGVDNGIAGDNLSVARSRIKTDPFYDLGYTGTGFIALLDTGVHASHILLNNPARISLALDCSHGGNNCDNSSAPLYNPDDLANHGTSSAGIISGTTNLLGNNWRGVSGSWVDNFRISGDLGGGTDLNAVPRAYDRAIFWGDWLVVATIQPDEGPSGSISTGANRLFDMGIAVLASNGNFSGKSRAPANATKVIGVGGYDVQSLAASPTGGIGTTDGRFKPDLRVPTNVETAAGRTASPSNNPCDACLQVYGGTSAAAPMAAGTAAVLRHFLTWNGLQAAPGNIYAGLLAFGDQAAAPDNGAGRIALGSPSCSRWWSGQADLAQGQFFDVPFSPDTGESDLRAAVWWPENYNDHRDIDMVAVKPDGSGAYFSTTVGSVFERVQLDGPLVAGNWNVRISGFGVPFGTQRVYYVMYTKRRC